MVVTGDYLQFGGFARAQYSVCSVHLLEERRMLETKCYESFTWLWKEHSSSSSSSWPHMSTGNAKLGSLPGKGPSLFTYCPLSAFFNPFLSPVWGDLLLEILFLVSTLFLKVCSFIQSPNLSCKIDLHPVEMVELSLKVRGTDLIQVYNKLFWLPWMHRENGRGQKKVASKTNLILLDLLQVCFHCSIACA